MLFCCFFFSLSFKIYIGIILKVSKYALSRVPERHLMYKLGFYKFGSLSLSFIT